MIKKKLIRTLGIDLSIGKVKLCLLTFDQEQKIMDGGWSSLPVDFQYISEKNYDFTIGLSNAIESFLEYHQTNTDKIKSVVFCTGGAYYMFPSFAEGMRYTASIIKMLFPRQKVYFIRVDGQLTKINDIFELEDSEASAYGCTNFLGTSLLATKTFKDGLAIDMGTISTSIIPIIDSKIDPLARYNPKGYMNHRYTTGKHLWYGAMHTSLSYITTKAKTKQSNYALILRSCTTSTLMSLLDLMDISVTDAHVADQNKILGKDIDFIRLAETVGLDVNILSKNELLEIAVDIYYQIIEKLSENIRSIINNASFKDFSQLKVLAAGLGQQSFIIPALINCGFTQEQIITVTEGQESNIWTATSVYGLALIALEKIIGEEIDISIESITNS